MQNKNEKRWGGEEGKKRQKGVEDEKKAVTRDGLTGF